MPRGGRGRGRRRQRGSTGTPFVHNEGRARRQFLQHLQAENASSFVQDMATYALEDELKVEGHLGGGGFGTVSKVLHRRSGVRYALKKINDNHSKTQYKAAVIEISALTMVQGCDNVLAMIAADDGKPGAPILMELCVGTMADIVYGTNPRKHSTADVLRFLAEGASGLAWCHDRSIVHADVKSNNVLVRRQPHGRDGGWHDMAVIADFGYAMSVGQCRDNGRGTPGYTPPEVFGRCKGRGVTACGSQDVFAVGAMAGGALVKDHLRCCNIFTSPILFTPEEQHMRTVVENAGDDNLLNEFETKVMSRTMVDMSAIQKFLTPENMKADLPVLSTMCGCISRMIHPEVTNRPSASEVAFLFKCWSLRAGAGDQDLPARLALHMPSVAGEEATSPATTTTAPESAVARAATRIATRWRCFKERHFSCPDPKWGAYDVAFTRDNNSSAAAALPAMATATGASATVIAGTAPPPSPPLPPPPSSVLQVTDLEAEFFALAVKQDQAELNATRDAGVQVEKVAEAALKRILRIGIPSHERATKSNVQSTPPGADGVVLQPAPVAAVTRTGAAAAAAAGSGEVKLKRLLGIAPYCRTTADVIHPTPPASRDYPVSPSGPAADGSVGQGWDGGGWGHFVFIDSPGEGAGCDTEKVSLPPPSRPTAKRVHGGDGEGRRGGKIDLSRPRDDYEAILAPSVPSYMCAADLEKEMVESATNRRKAEMAILAIASGLTVGGRGMGADYDGDYGHSLTPAAPASPAAGHGLVDERLSPPLPSPSHRRGVKHQQNGRRAKACLKTALGNPPTTARPVTNIMSRNTITADLTPPKSGGDSYKPKDTARVPGHTRLPWFHAVVPAPRHQICDSQPVAYGPGRSNAMLCHGPKAGIERERGGFDAFGLGRVDWRECGGGGGVRRPYPFGMFGADQRIWGTGWGAEGPFHVERW